MRSVTQLITGLAAFAGIVAAQSTALGFTSVPASVQAGVASVVSYTAPNLTIPVTITLRKGDPSNLQTIQQLTSSATGGNYTWIPLPSFANANDYALQIQQGNTINYSGAISLSGADPAAVSSAMAVSASLSSAGAAITQSYASQASVSSLSAIIASYNASLYNLTAPPTTSSFAASSSGTGTAMIRNTTMVTPTLTSTASVTPGAGAGSSSSASRTGTATGSSAAATSSGAAAKAVSAISGASPLALVFCVFAGVFI